MANYAVRFHAAEYSRRLRDELEGLVAQAGEELAEGVRARLQRGHKTGRRYGRHRASAPGQAPARLTGELLRSVQLRRDSLAAELSVSAEYAAILEFGGRRVAARPFLGPVFKRVRTLFLARAAQAAGQIGGD